MFGMFAKLMLASASVYTAKGVCLNKLISYGLDKLTTTMHMACLCSSQK